MLHVWDRKILSKVNESVTEKVNEDLRTNQELRELYKTTDLVANIISEDYGGWDMLIRMDTRGKKEHFLKS
jgi:hypothetical protein